MCRSADASQETSIIRRKTLLEELVEVDVIGNKSVRAVMGTAGEWGELLARTRVYIEGVKVDELIVRRLGRHGSIVTCVSVIPAHPPSQ